MKQLNHFFTKKSFKLGMTVLGAILISTPFMSSANADSPAKKGSSDDPLGGIVAAIKALGAEIQALATASADTANKMTYQVDQNLPVASQANSQSDSATTQAHQATASLTQAQVSRSLLQFPEQVVNPNQLSDPALSTEINNQKNIIPNLTVNTPGSDTLYINNMTDPLAQTYGVSKPSTTYDNYFNFDSLVTPAAYSSDQQKAAQAYIQYATQTYQSLTDGIDFAKLKSQLNNLSPAKRAQALETFVNNPVYQKYQLAIRSMLAAKSVALSNLNSLVAERTPVAGLAAKTSIPNDPALPAGYASALEVENYIANQRLDNPQWAEAVKTASPATISREQLMILAEIQSELQRNHLDNERLLATLSLMALQSNAMTQLSMQQQAQDVNNLIDPDSKQDADTPQN